MRLKAWAIGIGYHATMPFTHATVLGRRVLIDDWRSFHRDRLLDALYQMRELGGESFGLSLDQIANVTGLRRELVCDLVQSMTSDPPMIRLDVPGDIVRITDRGVRWVEESPRPSPPF